MLEMAEVPLIECIRMISETPARIMNIQDRKGSIAPGKDADIVIFNDQIEVQQTFVMGKSIFQKT
jgi:N-acetylglucosamine-6-phosphate deacetylase